MDADLPIVLEWAIWIPRLITRAVTNSVCTSPTRSVVGLFLLLPALLGAGCKERPTIRQYTISGKVPEVLQSNDRMLGVMIPQKSTVWFIKVVGPEDAVNHAELSIRDFAARLTFKSGEPDLTKLPEGWVRGPRKEMRYATVLIDTPTAQLDVSISQLPRGDDWDQQVALNVNRWRGQMKLESSVAKWAGAEPIKVAAADQDAVWVDLIGEMGAGPLMPPMSRKSPPFAEMAADAHGTTSPIASGQEPATPEPNVAPEPSSELKYETPEGWRPGKMSIMRLAAFNIGPEAAPAELTIISAGGDLRSNVARWLGQVRGDTPPNEVVDQALKSAETIQVSGRPGQRFILTAASNQNGEGSNGETGQAIDATIVPMETGMNLFIKATGPLTTLQAEKSHIGEFIGSLQLP